MELFLDYTCLPIPGVEDRVSLFQIIHYSRLLLVVYMTLWEACFATCELPTTFGLSLWLYVTLYPPESDALKKSGYCMRLWSASFVSSLLPERTAN